MWIAAFSDTGIIRIFSQITYVYLIRVFPGGQVLCSTQPEAGASHSGRRVRYITYCLMVIVFHSPRLHKHLKLEVIKKKKKKRQANADLPVLILPYATNGGEVHHGLSLHFRERANGETTLCRRSPENPPPSYAAKSEVTIMPLDASLLDAMP